MEVAANCLGRPGAAGLAGAWQSRMRRWRPAKKFVPEFALVHGPRARPLPTPI